MTTRNRKRFAALAVLALTLTAGAAPGAQQYDRRGDPPFFAPTHSPLNVNLSVNAKSVIISFEF